VVGALSAADAGEKERAPVSFFICGFETIVENSKDNEKCNNYVARSKNLSWLRDC
jgi:hypothetical protein